MKLKYYGSLLCALALSLMSFNALSMPAKKGLMTVDNGNGQTLEIRLAGDEFFHQYYTADGYPLIYTAEGFNYCSLDSEGNLIDSGIKATSVASRSAEAKAFLQTIDLSSLATRIEARASRSPKMQQKAERYANLSLPSKSRRENGNVDGPPYPKGYGLFSTAQFPAYGKQKAIIVLVQYTDVKFATNYSVDAKDYFTRMLNEKDFCDEKFGGTGSAAQFFEENSNGAFLPEFDVYGPITLAHNRAYYGANSIWGEDMRPHEMAIEACQQLDSTVDFREYDRDGDGIIDNIYVFYAGAGEASGGGPNTVWPHSWSLDEAGLKNYYFDGVRLNTYGCSNELESKKPDGVGTFVHEFSHVIGLPDLYNTSGSGNPFTPDEWSALDYGPYNNDGRTPPNYGAFERYALGWGKPVNYNRTMSVTLPEISNNVFGIVHTEKDTEFYLFENRQQTGWDTYIPSHGMLVWHIDYREDRWTMNTVNNNSAHQCVDIVEADNIKSTKTFDGDPFPGSKNVTEFSYTTNPALVSWASEPIDCRIYDIAESDGIITFEVFTQVQGPDDDEDFPSSAIENINADSAKITLTGNVAYTDAGHDIELYNVSGLLIAKGIGSVTIPTSGLYIISVPALKQYRKVAIK